MIPLPMTKNPRGEWETRSCAARRFPDIASVPEGMEIENAAPLDPAPRALPAAELATAATTAVDDAKAE